MLIGKFVIYSKKVQATSLLGAYVLMSRESKSLPTEEQMDQLHDVVLVNAYQYEKQQKRTLREKIKRLTHNNRLLDRYNQLLISNKPKEKGKGYLPGDLFSSWPGYLFEALVIGISVAMLGKVVEIVLTKELEITARFFKAAISGILDHTAVLWSAIARIGLGI